MINRICLLQSESGQFSIQDTNLIESNENH
jgi:hypothetical protein